MPYFPVDDQFAFHPKAIAAGNASVGLWTRAGSWCKAHAEGGRIPHEIAYALGTKREIDRLVKARLWIVVSGGYMFHDWDDQAGNFDANTEKQRREEERERNRERKRRQRERERSRGHGDSHGVTPEGVTPGVTAPPSPVPSPVPKTDLTDVTNLTESSQVSDGSNSGLDAVNDVVQQRARRAGIGNLAAVCDALAVTTGEPVSPLGAVLLSEAIVSKAKRVVNNVDAYIATTCRRTPDEVQQAYFDLDIGAVAS